MKPDDETRNESSKRGSGPPATATTRTVRPQAARASGPGAGADSLPYATTVSSPEGDAALQRAMAKLTVVERSRYRFGREVGRGGIGKVTRAEDRRLDRSVAVKELLSGPGTGRARFLREALITARLQHPAIIPVYDAGFWPDGAPFYAMKLVAGRTLQDLVAEAGSLAGRLAYLPNLITVAEAIAYAHSKQIIHRDLKPANVLVGEFGETVVVDWGLAKDLSVGLDSDDSVGSYREGDDLTRAGTIMGTPAYMSPEQARGELAGKSSDIYALGAMLYHLLTGRAPYASARDEDILKLLATQPPEAITAMEPEASRELVAIAEKAMAADVADRYMSAKELADDLTRFQTGQLVSAHAYSRRMLLLRWLRRHRAAVSVAGVLLVVLAVGAAFSVQRIVRERDTARHERALAEERQRGAILAEARAKQRRHELVLVQAQSALASDPTASLAWLKTLPDDATIWPRARAVAMEACRRGVARHVLRGHGQDVTAIAIAPDDRTLAAGSMDGGLRIWNLDDGTGWSLPGHRAPTRFVPEQPIVFALAWAPDGSFLASASQDGTVRLWRPGNRDRASPGLEVARFESRARAVAFSPDGAYLAMAGGADAVELRAMASPAGADSASVTRDLPGHGDGVDALTFSPDSALVVTAGAGGVIRVWATDRAELVHELGGHKAASEVAVFSPDGTYLATGSQDGTVRVWNPKTGHTLAVLPHGSPVVGLSFAGDGRLLATGALDGKVRLWAISGQTVSPPRVLGSHTAGAYDVAFAPGGQLVASTGEDGIIRLWRPSGAAAGVLIGHTERVYYVAFTRDGKYLVSASADSTVRVWPISRRASEISLDTEGQATALAFSPDGAYLAASATDGKTRLWQLEGGQFVDLPRHDGRAADVAFSPDGRSIATAGDDGRVRLYDRQTETTRQLGRHDGWVRFVRFSPDGRRLASASLDGTLRVWNLEAKNVPDSGRILRGHRDAVIHLRFLPDGDHLVSAGHDGTIRLWDVADDVVDSRHRVLTRHVDKAYYVAASPDGRFVASASADTSVHLYNLADGTTTRMTDHAGPVNRVEFSPDSRYLASIGHDRYAVLWDLDSNARRRLEGHDERLRYVLFSPDSASLITTSQDATVRIWDLATGQHDRLARLEEFSMDAAFAPDGSALAVSTLTGRIHMWRNDIPTAAGAVVEWLTETTSATVSDQFDRR